MVQVPDDLVYIEQFKGVPAADIRMTVPASPRSGTLGAILAAGSSGVVVPITETGSGTVTLTFPASGASVVYVVTKTANVTYAISGGRNGDAQTMTLVSQGAFTGTLPGSPTILWPNGTTPSDSTTALNRYFIQTLGDSTPTLIGSY